MTQENKELLLKDISARLPYGVKGITEYGDVSTLMDWKTEQSIIGGIRYGITKYSWRPYLFPLSSMTEEQRKEYDSIIYHNVELHADRYYEVIDVDSFELLQDFYHKNHLDYRGLIPMGLAIDATNLNIY